MEVFCLHGFSRVCYIGGISRPVVWTEIREQPMLSFMEDSGVVFLTLCGDLLKGILPVQMYLRGADLDACGIEMIFIIIAPVIGHIFPIFYKFRGGKGIAVTFGCLLGLFPNLYPVLILAFVFLLFSLIIRITPHYNRTLWTYRCAAVGMILFTRDIYIITAFLVITLVVNVNLLSSSEEREKCQVRILWKY